MTVRTFCVSFSGSIALTEGGVWPDGDAPENPTADDVAEVMRNSGRQERVLDEWNLFDGGLSVYVDGVEVW